MSDNNDYKFIKNNLESLEYKISKAAAKVGKKLEDITLIAVTKTVDPVKIKLALNCGVTDVGENKVQELCTKQKIFPNDCNWHMIGHLQRNKVRQIIDIVKLIHSVDSIELAEEINKRAAIADTKMQILIQINVSGEETKFGMSDKNIKQIIENLSTLNHIKVKGLMTIAPHVDNPEKTRKIFERLRNLSIDISRENIDNIDMDYLSMGMSNDFEVAIEEGSNIIRIGSAIFGKRLYIT